jgi:DNA-binding MarR family transcriptional regulator
MSTPVPILDLNGLPGHDIRRLHQIAVALFMQETEGSGVTPVQYAALQAVQNAPGLDQRTLARAIGFDTSTIAGVIDRLEARGLMQRNASAQDRRVRLLTLTDAGRQMVADVVPAMQRAQARILAPLPEAERGEFMRLLGALVAGHDDSSAIAPDS